jgi:hypothetical protein
MPWLLTLAHVLRRLFIFMNVHSSFLQLTEPWDVWLHAKPIQSPHSDFQIWHSAMSPPPHLLLLQLNAHVSLYEHDPSQAKQISNKNLSLPFAT